jgi:hypothetical protein
MSSPDAVISPERAVAMAVETAGSDDFGAPGWRDGLARSLDAFARMPLLTEIRQAAVAKVVQDLVTRLRIEQWHTAHPETGEVAVEGPVVVIGLPRTGTTAMVGMISRDARFRFLRAWEGAQPLPPPIAGEEEDDPRVIAARQASAEYKTRHLHIHDPDGPEEDLAMLGGLDMHAFHGAYPVPEDYLAWWMAENMASYYAFQERVFKLLQSRRGPCLWLLKSPPHLFHLEEIVRRYPNVKFVMTHRDPAKVIASVASLHCSHFERRSLPNSIDREAIGPRFLNLWTQGMQRALAARARIGEHRFVDVTNDAVIKHPLETFARIYEFLRMPLTPGLRDELQNYTRNNAPGHFGAHRYTPEEFGLSGNAIREAFGDYIERFAL